MDNKEERSMDFETSDNLEKDKNIEDMVSDELVDMVEKSMTEEKPVELDDTMIHALEESFEEIDTNDSSTKDVEIETLSQKEEKKDTPDMESFYQQLESDTASVNAYQNLSDEDAIDMGENIIESAKVKRYRLKKGAGLKLGAILSVFVVAAIFGLGSSFGWFTQETKGTTDNDIEAAVFEVAYEGGEDAIQLDNAYPISDEEGLKTTAYQFTITNKGNVGAIYQLVLSEHSITSLDRKFLRYTLKKNDGEESAPATLSNLTLLENQTLAPNQTDTYELKVWLSEGATNDAMGKRWVSKVQVVSKEQ